MYIHIIIICEIGQMGVQYQLRINDNLPNYSKNELMIVKFLIRIIKILV